MRPRLIASVAVALLMILAPGASASSQTGTGTTTFVHGIPGVTVDVYVRSATGPDFDLLGLPPGSVTDPSIQLVNAFPAGQLPAGTYNVEVYPTGVSPDSEDPAIASSFDVVAGGNVSVVFHWDVDRNPTLSAFPNDVSTLDPGSARVTIRHTAAAPAVDILVGGALVFTGLENGAEGVTELPAGMIEASVLLTASGDVVLSGVDIDLAEGVNTIIYAIGREPSPDVEQRFDLLVQTISGLHQAPSGVESGTGGLKATEQALPVRLPWAIGLIAVTAIGAGLGSRRIRRSGT